MKKHIQGLCHGCLFSFNMPIARRYSRVPNRFFGIREFPYLKLGIRDFKAKSRRDSGLKVCAGGGLPKITLGITGLHEVFGQDYGIEEP